MPMVGRRDQAAGDKQVEYRRALRSTSASDREEVRFVARGAATCALCDAKLRRDARTVELIAQRWTHAPHRADCGRERLKLDREPIAIQPFEVLVRGDRRACGDEPRSPQARRVLVFVLVFVRRKS
jgi:hypothetical protein